MDLLTNEHFLTTVVGVVVAFIFGQTGILKTWFDFLFQSKKRKKELEEEAFRKKEEETTNLKNQINELKAIVAKLDKDLTETTIYVKTLLSFLESAIPDVADGSNVFIKEMAKEIRKKNP